MVALRTYPREHALGLVQEAFCQTTATPSTIKYERDGGPGIAEIARFAKGGGR